MPELPEVEVVRRALLDTVLNKKIKEVFVYYRKIVSDDLNFEQKVVNKTVNDITRVGKYLIIDLGDLYLISHLRMEGKYFFNASENKHTHLKIVFSDNTSLIYNDTRKFGRFELYDKTGFDIYEIKKLAKEPYHLSAYELINKLHNKKIPIKEALLDQRIILGLGNIYANEVLFLSKIHPAKISSTISLSEAEQIIKHSIDIFDLAIKYGGSTITSFESLSHKGSFQDHLKVHFRDNQPCVVCSTPIKKVKLKSRGTYYCPNCQKSHVIAITGGIASGKTTVVNYLKSLGYKVIDSDSIVNELYDTKEVIDFVYNNFNIKLESQNDRKKLSNIVFNDANKLKVLSDFLHPLVFNQIDNQKKSGFEYLTFVDIPLLFETGYKEYDISLLIYTTLDNQIQRLMHRNNLNYDEALKRINTQMPINDKIELADFVIYNETSIDALHENINLFLRKF